MPERRATCRAQQHDEARARARASSRPRRTSAYAAPCAAVSPTSAKTPIRTPSALPTRPGMKSRMLFRTIASDSIATARRPAVRRARAAAGRGRSRRGRRTSRGSTRPRRQPKWPLCSAVEVADRRVQARGRLREPRAARVRAGGSARATSRIADGTRRAAAPQVIRSDHRAEQEQARERGDRAPRAAAGSASARRRRRPRGRSTARARRRGGARSTVASAVREADLVLQQLRLDGLAADAREVVDRVAARGTPRRARRSRRAAGAGPIRTHQPSAKAICGERVEARRGPTNQPPIEREVRGDRRPADRREDRARTASPAAKSAIRRRRARRPAASRRRRGRLVESRDGRGARARGIHAGLRGIRRP